jgi:hypothetical protein
VFGTALLYVFLLRSMFLAKQFQLHARCSRKKGGVVRALKRGFTNSCSLELSAAYFQPASSVFSHNKSASSTFSRLFSFQANMLSVFVELLHDRVCGAVLNTALINEIY